MSEVRDALAALQAATREVVAGVRGLGGSRPIDLANAIDIDLKLAWKVTHIAQSGEPFSCVRHLPGAAGWRIWTEAAAAHGASSASVRKATAALNRAWESGIAWAGDRRALLALAANAVSGKDDRFNSEHRRLLYEGGRHVWGVRAHVAMRLDVVAPDRAGDHLDCATIRGFIGFERLRPDARWLLEAPFVVDDSAKLKRRSRPAPLLPQSDRPVGEPPFLMPELCSGAIPSMHPVELRKGARALELDEGEVGVGSRATIVHGALLRRAESREVSRSSHGIFQIFKLRTPVELQVFDLLVHESIIEADAQPEAVVYGDLHSAPVDGVPYRLRDRLPFPVELHELRSGVRGLRLDGLPLLAAHVESILESLGWSARAFRCFRARIAYPPMPSTLVLELPAPGG